jgi:hypothetical protein
MNGVERDTGSAGLGANGEDLNVVLGRFQSWAATRAQTQPATPLTKPITTQGGAGAGKDAGDAREISYEQALRASRHRRPSNSSTGSPPNFMKKRAERSGSNNNGAIGAPPADPSSRRHEAEGLEMRPLEHRWPEVRFAKASAALVAAHMEEAPTPNPAPSAGQASHAKSSSRSAESPVSVPAIAANTSRRATGIKRAAEKAVAAKPSPAAVVPLKIGPVQKPDSPRDQLQPTFRDVLKGTAAQATSPVGSSALSTGKSTCLTLRVSDGEQARIQACAAQANLSVSAYLRQCALGVDELRNQVEAALLKLQKEQERELPQPGFAAIPGIFRRFGMRCLQGFRRTGDKYPAVSVR